MGKGSNDRGLFTLRTAVILISGVLVGVGAAAISFKYIEPGNPGTAIIAAAVAFAGTVSFLHTHIQRDEDDTPDNKPTGTQA